MKARITKKNKQGIVFSDEIVDTIEYQREIDKINDALSQLESYNIPIKDEKLFSILRTRIVERKNKFQRGINSVSYFKKIKDGNK